MTNVGSTWFGPTAMVREAAGIAEAVTRRLLRGPFRDDPGQWPGWYRGVEIKYAGEIAVNYCVPDAPRADLLDAPSTSTASITRWPHTHFHCEHTHALFSRHHFIEGSYSAEAAQHLDLGVIHNDCLALSLLSRGAGLGALSAIS